MSFFCHKRNQSLVHKQFENDRESQRKLLKFFFDRRDMRPGWSPRESIRATVDNLQVVEPDFRDPRLDLIEYFEGPWVVFSFRSQ